MQGEMDSPSSYVVTATVIFFLDKHRLTQTRTQKQGELVLRGIAFYHSSISFTNWILSHNIPEKYGKN